MSKVQRARPAATSGLARSPLVPSVEAPIIEQRHLGDSQTPEVTESVTSRARESDGLDLAGQPMYLRLLRKEARLRVDQVGELAAVRRQLMRRRVNRGAEIITDNTLIRVAVDLLLTRARELHGDTEEELRAALGLPDSPSL